EKSREDVTGLSSVPVVLAHVNYADDADLNILAGSGASVAWCPRTHAYFDHPRRGEHPWRKMLAHCIPVCLATDSLASNPDLSLLREARHVLRCHPQTSPVVLMEMITTLPAQALGLSQQVGRLAAGFSADAILLPLDRSVGTDANAVCQAIVHNAPEPDAVWVMGRRVK
ncbi:MAG: amidohydrolase family protein, partial [Phycisphaerae bacterium]|nr:amidohydrolase family protein [Phycisphaerae bacterium]